MAVGFGGLEESADVALDEVVVVAENQVVAAVEAGEQLGDVFEVVGEAEVAQVVHFIFGGNGAVPHGHEVFVHFFNAGEAAELGAEFGNVFVGEVEVGGKEDFAHIGMKFKSVAHCVAVRFVASCMKKSLFRLYLKAGFQNG